MRVESGVSERHACGLVGVSRNCARYVRRVQSDESRLRDRIWGLAHAHKRFGYRRIWELLLREGEPIGKTRLQRIWQSEGLSLRHRKARKRRHGKSAGLVQKAERMNQVWSYDFMQDRTMWGGVLKILNVVDEYTREGLRIEIGRSLPSARVLEILAELFLERGAPAYLRSDNGPEFIAQAVQEWLEKQGCHTLYIHPGSPWENGHIESFNGKVRDEFLNLYSFRNVQEAQALAREWLREYNEFRPHSSLGYRTPKEFAQCSGSCVTGCLGPSLRSQSISRTSVVNL